MRVHDIIYKKRQDNNMSLSDLEAETGISRSTLQRMESGHGLLTVDRVSKIENAFKMKKGELYSVLAGK